MRYVIHYDTGSYDMPMSKPAPLADRQAEFTRRLLLEAAIELIAPGAEVTLRAVARRANISERTLFRYFASRDEFFDALAVEALERMQVPPPPRTMEELASAPRRFYQAFEAQQKLVQGGLDLPELHRRLRSRQTAARWTAVRKLLDGFAPRRSGQERRLAAANISYHLGATAWQFFRFDFRFTLDESVAAAETAVQQLLLGLQRR